MNTGLAGTLQVNMTFLTLKIMGGKASHLTVNPIRNITKMNEPQNQLIVLA